MEVRSALLEDAPALGRVIVEAWLSAHRGQMPEEAWRKRVEEWTPEVSAEGWARLLSEMATDDQLRTVLLVAEEGPGEPVALVLGTTDESDASGATAQVIALYVLPSHQRHGAGRLLLHTVAAQLRSLGFTALRIGVLTSNLPAREFYEAMGGREVEQRTFDEEGLLLPETVYAWPDLTALLRRE
ncbi:GNAT family N-acetyltransferase [Nocardioides cavernae]|uniref:GNAT family N-acetyltransferase n=1 Tax=Nocardioides cavernae TaxID=1921566 RepID=A0ABR8NH32_9ACTN|nr:GNAT family N-acetyltransferase [Nocardioides cavernae]MBD3926204.1 GNAT family N-acetyltransferase [Nocardioides cavernae]MBM7513796.1 GNAT superfamily N-acetyltransferase [Nocardioides cavernae]